MPTDITALSVLAEIHILEYDYEQPTKDIEFMLFLETDNDDCLSAKELLNRVQTILDQFGQEQRQTF